MTLDEFDYLRELDWKIIACCDALENIRVLELKFVRLNVWFLCEILFLEIASFGVKLETFFLGKQSNNGNKLCLYNYFSPTA